MTKPDVILRACGVKKSFTREKETNAQSVLNELDLEIERGSLVVIRGESGCGKSTLLRILGLVDHEFSGHLEICGEQVRSPTGEALAIPESEALRSRHIGFVFQDDLLLPLMSLRENGELPARIHRLPRARITKRLGRLQEFIFRAEELAAGVMGRRRTSVSGGQRQRAAILRALSHGPDLILADEPTASLDPKLKAEVVTLFRELCQAGATILVASHDSVFLDQGKTYELENGKLHLVEGSQVEQADSRSRANGLEEVCSPDSAQEKASRGARGCPPSLQLRIALREALGNPLFAFMIVAAMAAGLFQLTMLWSVQAGTDRVLDRVINEGSRLDRIEVQAKSETAGDGDSRLPSPELLAKLGTVDHVTERRELILRMDDARGREFTTTVFGLVADDPELAKLEVREGHVFDHQDGTSVLLTEGVLTKIFGQEAVESPVTGRNIKLRFRRLTAQDEPDFGFAPSAAGEMETIEVDFQVVGVVDRAETSRKLYLPQGTLMTIATWQTDPRSSLELTQDRLTIRADHEGGLQEAQQERTHLYFDDLDEVLPAASFFERQGYSIQADLYRYKWILDTRKFVTYTLGGIVAMVMGIAGLLIVSNVVSGVRMKRKEIAVLKLMGMRDRDVVSIFVLSVLLCAMLGGAMGFGGGGLAVDSIRSYLTSAYPDSPLGEVLTSTWPLAGQAFLFSALVAVGFTVYPAWRTARREAVWTLD